jgi:hypothetical protein
MNYIFLYYHSLSKEMIKKIWIISSKLRCRNHRKIITKIALTFQTNQHLQPRTTPRSPWITAHPQAYEESSFQIILFLGSFFQLTGLGSMWGARAITVQFRFLEGHFRIPNNSSFILNTSNELLFLLWVRIVNYIVIWCVVYPRCCVTTRIWNCKDLFLWFRTLDK